MMTSYAVFVVVTVFVAFYETKLTAKHFQCQEMYL